MELVIVIAVIAVLAAVLIPTFANITNRANESAALQTVENVNLSLQAEETLDGEKAATMTQALAVASSSGYNIESLTPTEEGLNFYWHRESNRFVLANADGVILHKDDATEVEAITSDNKHEFYKVANDPTEAASGEFNYYLGNKFPDETTELSPKSSVEVGNNYVDLVYTADNVAAGTQIIVYSNETRLTSNGDIDITEYGNTLEATIDGSSTYTLIGYTEKVALNNGNLTVGAKGFVNAVVIGSLQAENGDSDLYNLVGNINDISVNLYGGEAVGKFYLPSSITAEQLNEKITGATINVNDVNTSGYGYTAGIEYVRTGNGITINGLGKMNPEEKVLSIPSEFNGVPVTTISKGAFWRAEEEEQGSYEFTTVYIPDSVTLIDSGYSDPTNPAFGYNDTIKKVVIEGQSGLGAPTKEIGTGAFYVCTNIQEVIITGEVSIGNRVFYQCGKLKTVTLGSGITKIGLNAFGSCSSLTDIYYGGTQEQWEALSYNFNNTVTIHYGQ